MEAREHHYHWLKILLLVILILLVLGSFCLAYKVRVENINENNQAKNIKQAQDNKINQLSEGQSSLEELTTDLGLKIENLEQKTGAEDIDPWLSISTIFGGQVVGLYNNLYIVNGSITNADISTWAGISWYKINKSGSSLADLENRIHSDLAGLLADDHTQYLLLNGRSGGQTAYGGTTASQNLVFDSTSDPTKGYIILNPSGGNVGIGTSIPGARLNINNTADVMALLIKANSAQTQDTFQIIKSDGTTRLTAFEADGTLQFENDATVWDDVRIPGLQVRTNNSAPDLISFGPAVTNLLTYGFNGSGAPAIEQVYFVLQIPHTYKEGSNIIPHIHWSPINANAGNVVWQLEYTWTNIDGTFSVPTTIETSDPADGVAWKHQMVDFPTVTGTGKTISSMLVCRLFRDFNHVGDTYLSDAAFLEFDVHIEIDTLGSRQEDTK